MIYELLFVKKLKMLKNKEYYSNSTSLFNLHLNFSSLIERYINEYGSIVQCLYISQNFS